MASGSADEHAVALRAAVQALRSPQAAKRAPAPTSSVYERAARAVPADVGDPSTRDRLERRARLVEGTATLPGTSLVLAVLPDAGPLPPAMRASLQSVVRRGAVVVALGRDVPRDVPAGRQRPLTVPLRPDDDLAREWALVVTGPARRTAFLARVRPDGVWDWLVTEDAVAVHRAASALLERVTFLRLRVPELG